MAPPVPFKQVTQQDPRDLQQKRIADASLAHADAILSAYDLLQKLHDTGTLDVLRGAVGARDALLEQLASVLSTPEAEQALRNLIVLGKALGSVDPVLLKAALDGLVERSLQLAVSSVDLGLLKAALDGAAQATARNAEESPSLWQLAKRARSKDARRGLAMAVGILEALGRVSRR
jgi:uncharacterized protein YjgD (DUF1641 family)